MKRTSRLVGIAVAAMLVLFLSAARSADASAIFVSVSAAIAASASATAGSTTDHPADQIGTTGSVDVSAHASAGSPFPTSSASASAHADLTADALGATFDSVGVSGSATGSASVFGSGTSATSQSSSAYLLSFDLASPHQYALTVDDLSGSLTQVILSFSGGAEILFAGSGDAGSTITGLLGPGSYDLLAQVLSLNIGFGALGGGSFAFGFALSEASAPAPAPEPVTLLLLATGLVALGGVSRRRSGRARK